MTPDDKRRLAEIRADIVPHAEKVPGQFSDRAFLLRLLDEALEGECSLTRGFEAVERECRGIRQKLRGTEAQRGAAMAALREIADLEGHDPEYTDYDFARDVLALVNRTLAAHMPADPVEKEGSEDAAKGTPA